MFGKSQATIAARRDAKLRSVTTVMNIAERFPTTVFNSHKIPDDFVEPEVQAPLAKLWDGLDDVDKAALKTGKGCNSKPPPVTAYLTPNFLEFLYKGAKAVGIACYGTYTEDAYRWARQIVTMNPHTFPGGIGPYDVRLRKALENLIGEETVYATNPSARHPNTLVEARYSQLYLLANSPDLARVEWNGNNEPLGWPEEMDKQQVLKQVVNTLRQQLREETPMFWKELEAGWPANGNIEPLIKRAYSAYVDGALPRREDMV
jgi:hypothetical protein